MRRAISEGLRDVFSIQSNLDKIVVGVLTPIVVALLVYALTTGSRLATSVVLFLVGYLLTYLPVRVALRGVGSRRTLAGRILQGYALVAVIVLGLGASAVLPDLLDIKHTALGGFVSGLGYGAGFAAMFRLMHPVATVQRRS